MKNSLSILFFLSFCLIPVTFFAQVRIKNDTVPQQPKDDRNVMMNAAAANAGPRTVNIGLPANVGGTTIYENGLPVVFVFYPESPSTTWRMDAMSSETRLMNLTETAIKVGDIGFSLGTYDNLGTDVFKGVVNMKANHFGSILGTFAFSGPVNKNGLKYAVGGYGNFDRGTTKIKGSGLNNYYSDRMHLYKVGLTQDYKFDNMKGAISILYKYANNRGFGGMNAPFIYHMDGSITKYKDFKIGKDNYIAGQKYMLVDAYTGKLKEVDGLKDFASNSHTIYLIGNNDFKSGVKLNYSFRYHTAKTSSFNPAISSILDTKQNGSFVYEDSKKPYNGDKIQSGFAYGFRNVPVSSFDGILEIKKQNNLLGSHDWTIGLTTSNYKVDNFTQEGFRYYQTVEPNPKKLKKIGSELETQFEYHHGTENKQALYFMDKWDVSNVLTLNIGARIQYHRMRGQYQNIADQLPVEKGFLNGGKTRIKNDWWNKAFVLSTMYKVTERFGILADAGYNEDGGGYLATYSVGHDPNFKTSRIPSAAIGFFYNHDFFNIVSKLTYIQRNEYRSNLSFINEVNNEEKIVPIEYAIKTVGWTTDILLNPTDKFNIHFLLTIQDPKYKNYKVTPFDKTFDFSGKSVAGVSNVLIEIDPRYQFNKLGVWASGRYFSKSYSNLNNSLENKSRWETFAGADYQLNKQVRFNMTVTNPLNKKGIVGSIPGSALWTKEQAEEMAKENNGFLLSGGYMLPFTIEFGINITL